MEGTAHWIDYTENDEAIARAIAEDRQSKTSNCPGRHGLEPFQASNMQRVSCNGCSNTIANGRKVWSCVQCNFDLCEACHRRGVLSSSVPDHSSHSSPSSSPQIPSSHMCLVPCQIGSMTVEMLVDTGAQSSVLSSAVVRQLGLTGRVDRRYQGVAAGVGRARISGKLRDVVCAFGQHVEFPMDFIILSVDDPLCIMGLDQMRKYKCLVDLQREKLVFGGTGGVEVDFLPPERAHFDAQYLNSGCIVS
mmetsp:Transcript_7052/g.16323  ORF Transcript_7052/g.16323 Transcript_7052/m.16323 type:complete len:248 (-) Transcript_7052:1205-1948(-)